MANRIVPTGIYLEGSRPRDPSPASDEIQRDTSTQAWGREASAPYLSTSAEEVVHVGKSESYATRSDTADTTTSYDDFGNRNYIAPAYQESWNEIFISERYRPKAIRFMSLIMSIYFLGSGALDWLGDPGHRGEWGGYLWTIKSSIIRPLGGILSFLTAIFFFLPVFQPFCVRHNDSLCVFWLVIVYMTQMTYFAMWDMRLVGAGGGGSSYWQYELSHLE